MTNNTDLTYATIKNAKKIYFVGIGGVSMYGLSLLASSFGYEIAGSDIIENERIDKLIAKNVPISFSQNGQQLSAFKPDCVVFSSACSPDNQDLLKASELNIPAFERGIFLGYLTSNFQYVWNIAGTHGKTTTTAMCDAICNYANIDRSTHTGALIPHFNNGYVQIGFQKKLFINEACEYANSFLNFKSTKSLILNIDFDHIDYFKTIDNLIDSFAKFAASTAHMGDLIIPYKGKYIDQFLIDYQKNIELRKQKGENVIINLHKYAIESDITDDEIEFVEFVACNIKLWENSSSFDLVHKGINLGRVTLPVSGLHNVKNATAAIAMAMCDDYCTFTLCQKALADFKPADGRFTYKGTYKGANIYTDYAHHPASTKVTIASTLLKKPNNLYVVYQPLTFDRVYRLFDEYVDALSDSTEVLLYEIFSDRENETYQMSSKLIADALTKKGKNAKFFKQPIEIFEELDAKIKEGDIVLFLGPEEVRSFADLWLQNKK